MSIDISFVIIQYNCIENVVECIASIENNCEDLRFEVIISSNSLYDAPSQQAFVSNVPNHRILFNQHNNGFAYGMNRGLEVANGKCCVIMNPDVKIKTNNVVDAYNFLLNNSKIGIVGPKVLNEEGVLQDSYREYPTFLNIVRRVYAKIIHRNQNIVSEKYEINKNQKVDWVNGAFMIFETSLISIVGKLDERFFLYLEDVDFCKRVNNHGYDVFYFPELVIEYQGDRKS